MPADRLSALDQSFLYVESPTAHMHVGWASVFEPPERGAPRFEEFREHVARRLRRAPRYRQIIEPVPFGLNAPVWVDDPHFDVSHHVVQAKSDNLGEIASACMSTPLPHDRPLWQLCIADRLEDGRVGVVGKAHHCMVDGIAAVELASLLLDPEPDSEGPEPDGWTPDPAPGRPDLLLGGMADFARDQLDLATLPARLAGRLNRPISSARRLGLLSRRLDDLQRVKSEFGVKLNDVLLAVAAGGVRRFQRDRGEDPIPLKTMVPVSVRARDEEDALGNRISFMFVDLPCDEPDAARRLRRIHAETRDRKRAGEPEGADDLLRSVSYAPTALRGPVSRIVASPRTFNLTVSNIPGLAQPMYMRGCRLDEAYPVVPIADRHALSIGMTTVRDGAFFGLYADPLALPDVNELAVNIGAEIDELLGLSEVGAVAPGLPSTLSYAG